MKEIILLKGHRVKYELPILSKHQKNILKIVKFLNSFVHPTHNYNSESKINHGSSSRCSFVVQKITGSSQGVWRHLV